MFRHYLLTGIRNLLRHKGYTLLNIFGLAIGLATSLFILLFVYHELSYDRFHKKADRIYRVCIRGRFAGGDMNQAITAQPMAASMRADYPEIENVVRLRQYGDWLVSYQDKKFHEERFLFADSTFFKVFDFELIQGDPETVLDEPRSVVLTESHARKYFGDDDPVGKMIKLERDTVLTKVTGVMRDVPGNSHIHFDMVGSVHTYARPQNDSWLSHNFYTYVLLKEGISKEQLEPRLNDMVKKYLGPAIQDAIGVTYEEMEKQGFFFGYYLQPLKSIHLNSHLQYEFEPNGNKTLVYIFIAVAVLILLVACINFMNLATARASTRAREVGLRKLVGAHKTRIVMQHLSESVFLVLVSFLVAVLLVSWLLHPFSNLIQIKPNLEFLKQPVFIPVIILFLLVTAFLAGSYPAFFLSSFQPAAVLKGSVQRGIKGRFLRSLLVVLQMGLSIFILVGAFITFSQLRYLIRTNPGFHRENVLVIRRSDALRDQLETFKQELLKNPNVVAVSHSRQLPGKNYSNNATFVEGKGMENTYLTWQDWIGFDYDKVFSLEMVDGRFFSRDISGDSTAVVINEAAVRSLGLEDPVPGKALIGPTGQDSIVRIPIIGVLRDFHFKSLHLSIEPMAYFIMRGNWEGFIPVRLSGNNLEETVAYVKRTWESFTSDYPFDYFWMEDDWARLYDTEKKTSGVFIAFAIISLIIAILGLIGLVSYTAVQRTKEVGVRKALGSTDRQIVMLFAKETGRFVLVSAILATPIWFAAKSWLQNFAYHIPFNILIFLFFLIGATILTLILAWLSVGAIAINASRNNPADSLRYE